ncbi:MAG TPA: hypothetical protein VFX30_09240 [bacterium]|nr:hypothetical protein [bacterium]
MPIDMTTLFVGFLFSGIGFVAWRYGRHRQSVRHLVLAAVLMVYGYFIPNLWAQVGIGSVLVFFLFWPKPPSY